MWKSMVSGKAIKEHMEDVYHDMIKVCTPHGAPLHDRQLGLMARSCKQQKFQGWWGLCPGSHEACARCCV